MSLIVRWWPLPFWFQGAFLCICSWGCLFAFKNEKYVVFYLLARQGPASSIILLAWSFYYYHPPAVQGDLGSVSGLGRFPGGGHGNPLQCSCLENPHGQRSLVGYSPWGSQRDGHDWVTKPSTALLYRVSVPGEKLFSLGPIYLLPLHHLSLASVLMKDLKGSFSILCLTRICFLIWE